MKLNAPQFRLTSLTPQPLTDRRASHQCGASVDSSFKPINDPSMAPPRNEGRAMLPVTNDGLTTLPVFYEGRVRLPVFVDRTSPAGGRLGTDTVFLGAGLPFVPTHVAMGGRTYPVGPDGTVNLPRFSRQGSHGVVLTLPNGRRLSIELLVQFAR